jgi:HNH endonuclease
MQLDHLQPYWEGGPTDEFNLWLACVDCNNARSDRTTGIDPATKIVVPLFNPRDDVWREHFEWTEEGRLVVGLTPIGRATVVALNLNRETLVNSRTVWTLAGWHPPKD